MWIIKIAILAFGVTVTAFAAHPSADSADCTTAQATVEACLAQN